MRFAKTIPGNCPERNRQYRLPPTHQGVSSIKHSKHIARGATIETSPDTDLVILTASYAPDFELCRDLNSSIKRFAAAEVEHHIVVPARDLPLFAELQDEQTKLRSVESLLPRNLLKIPGANMWLNMSRPFPPLRGWIVQQLVKLGYSAGIEAPRVLLADSDLVFIREFSVENFSPARESTMYRLDNAIDDALPRHRIWHEASHRLLGLQPPASGPLPDYITWPCLWDSRIVRAMLDRVSASTKMNWATAIGAELHFSEMILYGVYVDHLLPAHLKVQVTSASPCLNYSNEDALSLSQLESFLDGLHPQHVAVMVSAKAEVTLEDRRQALGKLTLANGA